MSDKLIELIRKPPAPDSSSLAFDEYKDELRHELDECGEPTTENSREDNVRPPSPPTVLQFALREAVRCENSIALREMLESGRCAVDRKDADGCTLLEMAIGADNEEAALTMVSVLLDERADVTAITADGTSYMHQAVARSRPRLLRLLLGHREMVKCRTRTQQAAALERRREHDDRDILRSLLDSPLVDRHAETLSLLLPYLTVTEELAEQVMKQAVDVGEGDDVLNILASLPGSISSALAVTLVQNRRFRVFVHLMGSTAVSHAGQLREWLRSSEGGHEAAESAVRRGDKPALDFFLTVGLLRDCPRLGHQLLLLACEGGHVECVTALLENQVPVNEVSDDEDDTAWLAAVRSGTASLPRALLRDYGAKPGVGCQGAQQLLWERNDLELLAEAIEAGASPNVSFGELDTPLLSRAIGAAQWDLLKVLLQQEDTVNVDLCDARDSSPLSYALRLSPNEQSNRLCLTLFQRSSDTAHAVDDDGRNLLCASARTGRMPLLLAAIDRGIPMQDAIMEAVTANHWDTLSSLWQNRRGESITWFESHPQARSVVWQIVEGAPVASHVDSACAREVARAILRIVPAAAVDNQGHSLWDVAIQHDDELLAALLHTLPQCPPPSRNELYRMASAGADRVLDLSLLYEHTAELVVSDVGAKESICERAQHGPSSSMAAFLARVGAPAGGKPSLVYPLSFVVSRAQARVAALPVTMPSPEQHKVAADEAVAIALRARALVHESTSAPKSSRQPGGLVAGAIDTLNAAFARYMDAQKAIETASAHSVRLLVSARNEIRAEAKEALYALCDTICELFEVADVNAALGALKKAKRTLEVLQRITDSVLEVDCEVSWESVTANTSMWCRATTVEHDRLRRTRMQCTTLLAEVMGEFQRTPLYSKKAQAHELRLRVAADQLEEVVAKEEEAQQSLRVVPSLPSQVFPMAVINTMYLTVGYAIDIIVAQLPQIDEVKLVLVDFVDRFGPRAPPLTDLRLVHAEAKRTYRAWLAAKLAFQYAQEDGEDEEVRMKLDESEEEHETAAMVANREFGAVWKRYAALSRHVFPELIFADVTMASSGNRVGPIGTMLLRMAPPSLESVVDTDSTVKVPPSPAAKRGRDEFTEWLAILLASDTRAFEH